MAYGRTAGYPRIRRRDYRYDNRRYGFLGILRSIVSVICVIVLALLMVALFGFAVFALLRAIGLVAANPIDGVVLDDRFGPFVPVIKDVTAIFLEYFAWLQTLFTSFFM